MRGVRPTPSGTVRKLAVAAGVGALVLAAGGCNLPTFGAFRGATTQAQSEFKLWSWMMIAGLSVLALVTVLIIWGSLAYRRRDAEHFPRQFHSNLPVEVLYTVLPILIVAVIFAYTVATENKIDALTPHPAVTIQVTGFQWGWKFQYVDPAGHNIAMVETAARPTALAQNPTSSQYPQFELPVGETTRIVLQSTDVVHTFYIPEFNFGRYALPGVVNHFDFTPVTLGTFDGRCATYCGLYHSEMLFSVKVVTPGAFATWLSQHGDSQPLASFGNTVQAPAS